MTFSNLTLPRVLILCLVSIAAHANDSGIEVAGVSLRLGADQSIVLERFKHYKLQCFDDPESSLNECNSIIIGSSKIPFVAYANIYFENSKLKKVYKYWDQSFSEGDVGSFVRALHGVLRGRSKGQPIQVILETAEKIDPGFTQKIIFISKGHKTVKISVNTGPVGPGGANKTWVNLHEELE